MNKTNGAETNVNDFIQLELSFKQKNLILSII